MASTGKRHRSSSHEVISDLLSWSLDPTTNFETTNPKVHEYFDQLEQVQQVQQVFFVYFLIIAFSLVVLNNLRK